MTRLVPFALAGALFGGSALLAQAPLTLRPAEAADLDIDLTTEEVSTPRLDNATECIDGAPRISRVELAWTAPDLPVLAQRLDVSKFRDGFDNGRFETTGEIDPAVRSGIVDTGEPGIYYYWRVLTRTGAGWVSSATARFEVPVCPMDEPRGFPGS